MVLVQQLSPKLDTPTIIIDTLEVQQQWKTSYQASNNTCVCFHTSDKWEQWIGIDSAVNVANIIRIFVQSTELHRICLALHFIETLEGLQSLIIKAVSKRDVFKVSYVLDIRHRQDTRQLVNVYGTTRLNENSQLYILIYCSNIAQLYEHKGEK
jgi:hypothetical protein